MLPFQVCFLPGTLAIGATKGLTKKQAMKNNMLNFEDLENLKLAEDLTKTCFEMYAVTSTGLAPEIAYFHTEVSGFLWHFGFHQLIKDFKKMQQCISLSTNVLPFLFYDSANGKHLFLYCIFT